MTMRCMFCGKVLDEEYVSKPDPLDDYYDDRPKEKLLSVCQMCQAKLKHEAEAAQKTPKPM